MPCALCGNVCHCASKARTGSRLRSRFRPEDSACDVPTHRSSVLIDPEADDFSEQKFAASLDETSAPSRFISDAGCDSHFSEAMDEPSDGLTQSGNDEYLAGSMDGTVGGNEPDFHVGGLAADLLDQSPSLWKQEVAARLHSYRARRKPRPPKYPSLRLKFEPAELARTTSGAAEPVSATPALPLPESRDPRVSAWQEPASLSVPEQLPPPVPEKARIIEFPRPYVPPVPSPDELAEAVAERPRILEVPEVEPPPPALGGILLENQEEKEPERRPGFEIPLKAGSMPRRICAAAMDGLLVLSACAIFGYVTFRLSSFVPPLPQLAVMAILIFGIFWSGYDYLLLVYAGNTPGLRAAGLRLCDFDGSPVPRSRRRWRVIASILSGLSLGLGFVWCFLDEDALCWHDRITHTYLAPSK